MNSATRAKALFLITAYVELLIFSDDSNELQQFIAELECCHPAYHAYAVHFCRMPAMMFLSKLVFLCVDRSEIDVC